MNANISEKIHGYDLSENQKYLWQLVGENRSPFYSQLMLNLKSFHTVEEVQKAMNLVVEKHQILSYHLLEKEKFQVPMQFPSRSTGLVYQEIEAAGSPAEEDSLMAAALFNNAVNDTGTNALQICLIKQGQQVKQLLLRLQGLWGDTYSLVYLSDQFCHALQNGQAYANATTEQVDYVDFSEWQKELIAEPEEEAVQFWRMYDYQRTASHLPFIATSLAASFSPKRKTISLLEGIAYSDVKKAGANLSDQILHHFLSYLFLFSDKDLTLGYIPFQRSYEELADTLGLINKTLPLTIAKTEEQSYDTAMATLKKQIEEVQAWADYYVPKGGKQEQNYFGHCFEFIDLSNQKNQSMAQLEALYSIQDAFDIKLVAVDYGDRLAIDLYYDAAKLHASALEVITAQLVSLFEEIGKKENLALPLTKAGTAIVDRQNATQKNYSKERTVIDLFRKQVRQHPDRIAVAYETNELSFKALDEVTNQFAVYLKEEYGIGAEDMVCLHLDRSEWMSIAILGVLKAGGAYVPMGTDYPEERIAYIKKDSQCKVCIDGAEVKKFSAKQNIYSTTPIEILPEASQLAYAIYTSGSTGVPKGVLNEHAGLYNRLLWMRDDLDIMASDVLLQKTPYTFDVSVWELIMPLITGSKLVFAKPEGHKDPNYLQTLIGAEQVSVIHFVPSMLGAFLGTLQAEKCQSLRHVVCSGEALPWMMVEEFQQKLKHSHIHNYYGPTEAAIDVTAIDLTEVETKDEGVSIGIPVANTQIYIVDKDFVPQAIGVPGELLIGGVQVARGYLNRPELNQEKFIKNPFGEGRVYRTGDLASWLPNGEIAYIGRMDNQVKIRGNRIELGEIENVLQQSTYVNRSIVLVWEDQVGNKQLVGYVIPEANYDQNLIHSHLQSKLPDYMIPAWLVELAEFPLTANGKIDRRALLEYQKNHLSGQVPYEAPTTDIEKEMVAIWEKEFDVEQIGLADNFFALGGDSIRAIRILSKMNNALGIDFVMADVYEHYSIKALLASMEDGKDSVLNATIKQTISDDFSTIFQEIKDQPEIEDAYPMSDIEMGMLYAHSLGEEKGVYHAQACYPVAIADFDQSVFKHALELMIAKHEALRTAYNFADYSKPVRLIYQSVEPEISVVDMLSKSRADQEQAVREYMEEERTARPFIIQNPGLWRLRIYLIDESEQYLVFQFHHAILDGWSRASFLTELNNTYYELLKTDNYQPQALSISYRDCVIEQEAWKKDQRSADYWANELEEYKRLEIFTDSDEVEDTFYTLQGEAYRPLARYCQEQNVSIRSLNLAAYLYSLCKLNYGQDILAGIVVNARPINEEGDQILGCFLNTLPFRISMENLSLGELVKAVHEKNKEGKKYEGWSLLELNKRFSEEKGGSNPFFDTSFNYVDFHIFDHVEVNEEVERSEEELRAMYFDLTNTFLNVHVMPLEDGFELGWNRNRGLRSGLTNTSIRQFHLAFLNALAENPNQKITELNSLQASEQQQLLVDFNDTAVSYPSEKTILQLFAEQVAKTPQRNAVAYQNSSLTFKELDGLSNQLANYLIQQYAIKSGELVAVKLERSEWMLIAILGILKTGAAYLPIDPAYPQERIDFIQKDSQFRLCLSLEELDKFKTNQNQHPNEHPERKVTPDDLAYAIYTSGSTGVPKGVLNGHAGLFNRLLWMKADLDITQEDKLLQKTPYTFDVSVWELLMPLITGSCLVFAEPEGHKDPDYLQSLIAKEEITIIHFVPSMLSAFLHDLDREKCQSLRHVVCSGEALRLNLVENFRAKLKNSRIHNYYGPTEAAIDVTAIDLTAVDLQAEGLTIGYPVANTQIYIVSPGLSLQPLGVPGELLIGGVQVAQGYLNRTELNKEKFIDHPFATGKVYRTGDLARWLPNGTIEYLGRIDHQVKIRGNRIELGEIENVIQASEQVSQSAVVVLEDESGNKRLVAYVLPKVNYGQESVYAYLRSKLPDYMIPVLMIELDEFPTTANGKLNRKALPSPDLAGMMAEQYVAPTSELQEQMAEIWQEVLGLEPIGIRDNFFQIGGDSIISIRLISRLNKIFEINLQVGQLYESNTIESLSQLIESGSAKQEEQQQLREEIMQSFDDLKNEIF